MKRAHLGAMLLCILFSCSIAHGQSATTSLRGIVRDPSGALVPGATVTVTNKSIGKTLSAVSNDAGFYEFAQIPPAQYVVSVAANGFGSQSKAAELLVNQPATIDFKLSMEASSVTVDVSASAQTLNTTDATLGDSVDNATIQALPMEGRDPISLLTLQPGVLYLGNPSENDTDDSRSGSVNGGRSDQGNITLDGMDDNDQVNGYAFTGVLRSTLDSTEEFRVTTSNGNADSGRSSGAQVSLITKAGTNSIHGSLYEYYRPTNTVSNQWFNKAVQSILMRQNRPPHYVENVFGGSVGGPIKKDRLFYFFNYEGQRKSIDDIVDQTVPTQQFYSQNQALGYQPADGGPTVWLSASQVYALDTANDTNPADSQPLYTPCDPSQAGVPCGVNPNVQNYYQPLNAAQYWGILPTVGDGVNNEGYVFPSPAPSTLNTSILKIDYKLNDKQQIFVRGNLQKDTQAGDENLPGQPAASEHEDNTKGFALGHTWNPASNIVNDARYSYVRQGYSTLGIGSGQPDWVVFRFIAQPESQALSTIVNVPVNNITDNLTWTKGTHTVSLGGNWRLIENNRGTDENSYTSGNTNPYWLSNAPNDPCALTGDCSQNLVASAFQNSYEIAYDTLVGTVPMTTDQYNYSVTSRTSGAIYPDGAFIRRRFRSNEFEYYAQDSWQVRPNLTLTFGLRHSILQAPYESHGQQVSPTVDTHNWFRERGFAAARGQADDQALLFAPSGKANGRPGYWAKQKANFAPRFAAVFAPEPHTTIRAGAGMFFDHFGEGIVNTFDQLGSFGLTNSVVTPASNYSVQTAPRFTGPHVIPSTGCPNPPPTVKYPFAPISAANGPSLALNCGLAIGWGIDNHLKTPYAYGFDFSIQHEFPGGFTFEENYVGRLGRHLLQQLDLAEPVDLVDSKGGGDYFSAAAMLSHLADENGGNPNAQVKKIQYFEDMFPFETNADGDGASATQTIYRDEWVPARYNYGETGALYNLDLYDNPAGPQFQFWQSQFSSLYSWSSIGNSSYNALQLVLRHPNSHGLTVDASYTLSKSLDMGSNAERSNINSSDNFGGAGTIQNSWNPKLNKGPSDFDARNLVTVDWVYAFPVGRGKPLLGSSSHLVDALLGGWQFSGDSRWASGLPFSVEEPGWSTNWDQEGNGVVTAPVQVKKHIVGGVPTVFAGNSANTINNGVYNGSPIRLPYPGEAGERNNFRGDGYVDIDSALAKTWNLHEQYKLEFAGEVYNVPNNVRFDDSPINLNTGLTSATFGAYGGMLTTYRRMQFGLRFDF